MMQVIDGARVIDGANNASDIPLATYPADTSTVSAAINMQEPGHGELIVNGITGQHFDDGAAIFTVEESNEENANFTGIPGGSAHAGQSNSSVWIAVDWINPERKKFARIKADTADGDVVLSAVSLRVRPHQEIAADAGIVLA